MNQSPPQFRVVSAPRLEPLAARLVEAMRADPLPPLARETVVVAQNVGLRRWVEREVAARLGVAASLDLRSPRDLVTALVRALPGSSAAREQHPFDALPLAWRLDPILAGLPEDDLWEPLRAYLARTGGRTMPLAARLAGLFDDYQVYRPDVLCGWAEGAAPPSDFPHGAWQAALWRRLVAEAGGAPDRAAEARLLCEALAEPAERLRAAFPSRRVSVFGALLFPPEYLRVLRALARHVPVTVYAVTPGAARGDGTHAHPLLRALAGQARDYWTVLADLGPDAHERDEAAPFPETALGRLQAALADDQPAGPLHADASLCVHDCHSPTRELEALRDSLLTAFAEIDGLRPSDVLVLVPDLATYAPLVDAVFGAEDAAPGLRLPYHIVDHPHAPALRVVEAFGRALHLHDGRVTASELLDLLGTPAVRRAAGIREDEMPRLRAWIAEAGVCWGLDADRKARFDVPADDLHTWRFGLDRLLLGVLAGDADGALVLGHLPCTAASGDADLLGRFCEWAEALFASLAAIDRPAPLADWPARLLTFLDGVFDARDDEELEAVVFLRQEALSLSRLQTLLGHDGDVTIREVRAHLDGAAGRLERREPYLTGRVTVAHPMALRHAPHRVVAFLGLNDGQWPRPELPPGFDLIAHAPRPGDAAPRESDKQLFVDAVMAARDRLLLSYVGRSQKDNAERASSVCLDAFLDATGGPEGLVVSHRLQPFAADYYAPGGPLASYAAQHHVGAGSPPPAFFDGDALPDPDGPPETLALAELVRAWTDPSAFLLRDRLHLSLHLDEEPLSDEEPLVLQGLASWRVREAVLAGVLDGLDEDTLRERLLRSGLLPAGASGEAWLRTLRQSVEGVAETVAAWGKTAPRPVEVAVEGAGVVGTLERVGARGGLRYRAGRVREKDLVAAWADHLALCAADPAWTCAAGLSGTCHFEPLDPADARHYLQALVRGYRAIRTALPPLFEKASYAYADKLGRSGQKAWADRILARERAAGGGDGAHGGVPGLSDWPLKQARQAFEGGFGRRGDADQPHVALATRGRDPFGAEAETTHKWAMCLWGPLLTHRRDGVPS